MLNTSVSESHTDSDCNSPQKACLLPEPQERTKLDHFLQYEKQMLQIFLKFKNQKDTYVKALFKTKNDSPLAFNRYRKLHPKLHGLVDSFKIWTEKSLLEMKEMLIKEENKDFDENEITKFNNFVTDLDKESGYNNLVKWGFQFKENDLDLTNSLKSYVASLKFKEFKDFSGRISEEKKTEMMNYSFVTKALSEQTKVLSE